jgi:hypothetical protein
MGVIIKGVYCIFFFLMGWVRKSHKGWLENPSFVLNWVRDVYCVQFLEVFGAWNRTPILLGIS